MKKLLALMSAVTMLFAIVPFSLLTASADSGVKISSKEYQVIYSGAGNNLLCNKISIGSEPGTEIFLTYTVDEYTSGARYNGVCGTNHPEYADPIVKSGRAYWFASRKGEEFKQPQMLMEGYTYLIKFTILEVGYRYSVARMKDDKAEYLYFETYYYNNKSEENLEYFGLYLHQGENTNERINAKLTHVRCYDRYGNDLGIWSPSGSAITDYTGTIPKDKTIDHKYTVIANGWFNLAVSNAKPLTTKKMYIEYKVVTNTSQLTQSGIAFSNAPAKEYPHGSGYLKFATPSVGATSTDALIEQGAEYLIVCEKGDSGFTVLVQKTKNGKTTVFTLPGSYYKVDETSKFQYFSIWFGENKKIGIRLEDLKMYDENKNNLGVQANRGISIMHIGSLTDYTPCEAAYYNSENGGFYELMADKTFKHTIGDGTSTGTYSISKNVLTTKKSGATEKFNYDFMQITNEQSGTYKRLSTYTVNFVTGSDDEIAPQILSNKTGYSVLQPTDPKLEGCEFKGWYTGQGKKFEFNKVQTKSVVLYAKWTNDAGVDFLATDSAGVVSMSDLAPYIAITSSVVLFAAAAVAGILILKGGRKNVNE